MESLFTPLNMYCFTYLEISHIQTWGWSHEVRISEVLLYRVVSCKMQMQSSLVSYSNNRVIRWVWNNANLIYLISGFSILHLQTDKAQST